MKKFLAIVLTICMIVTSTAFAFPFTAFAEDANSTITVTDVDSLNQAIKDIANGGTITVNGDMIIPESNSGFTFSSGAGKTYTITGGSFDFSALTSSDGERGFVHIKDNVTFENTKFIFDSAKNDYIFANGYDLTISETVTFEGAAVYFYGGVLNGGCKSVNVTLLSGNYKTVYAASNSKQTVSGDVNIHIGGSATVTDILGNSGGSIVEGDVNVLVDGNAVASGVYGGGNGGTVNGNAYVTVGGNADIKLIYGGGSAGTIKGNTYVTVKDSANPNSTPSDSSHNGGNYNIYGGGKGTIEGSTNVYFMDNAKAGYVVGGMAPGSNGSIANGANVYIMGGTTYSVYGCGTSIDHGTGANIIMTGGTAWQVFGGCESSSVTGDVTIKLLGGTVKRRVYGGCYNETSGLSFGTSYSVTGNITLIIDSNVNIDFSSTDNDRSIYAHSRHDSPSSAEISAILFTDSNAYNTYNSKLGAQDTAMSLIMGNTSSADATHCHSYAINDNIVTQTCTCGNSAAATITARNTTYTGEEINASIEYSEQWEYDKFEVVHSNNVNAGTATATFSVYNNQVHSVSYSIFKRTQKAPSVTTDNNTIKGLTTAMEYSNDNGATYTAVTNPEMTFEAGKYYVRYAAIGENVAASPVTKVFFGSGISANKVSALNGKTVEVIINMPVNSGISTLDLAISYNTTALTLDNVTVGSVVGATYANGKLTWSGENTTKTGILAKLTFTVSETAAIGSYDITLSQEGFSIENGTINVVEYVTGDVGGDDGKITISDIVDLRNAIANAETGTLASGADANGDGAVDVRDLIVIRQYIANYDYDAGESSVVLGGAQ